MLFFLRWAGTVIAHISKFLGVQHKKKTFERRQCIPNMRFVREEAYSSAYWLIWRLRRPRFHDVPQISCTTWCEIQTFGFVNASILLIKIGDVKLRVLILHTNSADRDGRDKVLVVEMVLTTAEQ